jgi:hypothetical protein
MILNLSKRVIAYVSNASSFYYLENIRYMLRWSFTWWNLLSGTTFRLTETSKYQFNSSTYKGEWSAVKISQNYMFVYIKILKQ